MTQLTFAMRPNGQKRPIRRDPATLEKIEKIDEKLTFWAFYIRNRYPTQLRVDSSDDLPAGGRIPE